jgi:hypothetical protein
MVQRARDPFNYLEKCGCGFWLVIQSLVQPTLILFSAEIYLPVTVTC